MIKSKPVFHIRLVRNSGVDQGTTMKVLEKVVGFVWLNRRPIGLIVGSLLASFGYPEIGNVISRGAADA